MLITIIISLVCVYLCYVILCRHFLPQINEQVPTYPGRLPIIGHSHMWLNNETLIITALELGDYASKVGGVTKFFMGPLPIYVVSDPVDVPIVLNKCLKKMFVYRFIEPMIGNTLMAADVPTWKRNRRILDPCFKQNILDDFLKLFSDRAGGFVELLAEDVGKGEVDLTAKITQAVVETACQTTLGLRIDGKDLVDNNFLKAVTELLDIPVARINKPWLMLDFIFNLSSFRTTLDNALAISTKLTTKMLNLRKSEHLQRLKTKEEVDYKGDKFQCILDVLLENTVFENEEECLFTDIVLQNIIDNVLIGGFDTTIGEMLFTFACIGTYPEVQDKIYQEITQVLGEDGKVTKQNISQLVYLEAAIKESLRLYPTVGMVAREAITDTKLRNVTIPAGSSVLVHIWSINRNTDHWGADAEEFKPERWLNPPTHKGAFASFSPGLRGCIGKTYALMYMKATMAQVLRRFKLTADHTNMKLACAIMLKPVAGHLVRIEERRSNK